MLAYASNVTGAAVGCKRLLDSLPLNYPQLEQPKQPPLTDRRLFRISDRSRLAKPTRPRCFQFYRRFLQEPLCALYRSLTSRQVQHQCKPRTFLVGASCDLRYFAKDRRVRTKCPHILRGPNNDVVVVVSIQRAHRTRCNWHLVVVRVQQGAANFAKRLSLHLELRSSQQEANQDQEAKPYDCCEILQDAPTTCCKSVLTV